MNFKKFISPILLILFLIPNRVQFAQTNNLIISPALVRSHVEVGTTKEFSFKFATEQDRVLQVSLKSLTRTDSSKSPEFIDQVPPELLVWFGDYTKEFKVLKNVENVYKINLTIPEEFRGNYNFALIFKEEAKLDASSSNTAASSEIAVPFIINAKKEGEDLGEVLNISSYIVNPGVVMNQTGEINIILVNEGLTYVIPRGVLSIESYKGVGILEKEDFSINTDNRIMFKGSTLGIQFDKEFNQNYIGQAKANLTLVYGLENRVISQEIYFWILPTWFIMLIVIVISIIIILILIKIIKRKLKWRKK